MTALASCHIAASTADSYSKGTRYFLRFLAILYGADVCYASARRLVLIFLAAPDNVVLASYAAFLARPNARTGARPTYHAIKQYFKGVSFCLRMYGHASPLLDMGLTRMVLAGARRMNGSQPTRKTPITPDMLAFFVSNLAVATSHGATMRAAMLVCFFAMLRKSSVCGDRYSPLSSFAGLQRGHVCVSADPYALVLSLHHAKTNQFGERVTVIHVAGRLGHPLDPVSAFSVMCELCPVAPSQPAFCYAAPDGSSRLLSHQELVATTKHLAARMGAPAHEFSGHSYRRGGATCAHAAGVSGADIMRTGDWASLPYLDYIWRSPAQCLTCSVTMITAIATGSLPQLCLGNVQR